MTRIRTCKGKTGGQALNESLDLLARTRCAAPRS